MITRYNEKTKEVEPEIKDIKQRSQQLTSDCKWYGSEPVSQQCRPWEKIAGCLVGKAVARMCLTQRKQKCSPHRERVGKLNEELFVCLDCWPSHSE